MLDYMWEFLVGDTSLTRGIWACERPSKLVLWRLHIHMWCFALQGGPCSPSPASSDTSTPKGSPASGLPGNKTWQVPHRGICSHHGNRNRISWSKIISRFQRQYFQNVQSTYTILTEWKKNLVVFIPSSKDLHVVHSPLSEPIQQVAIWFLKHFKTLQVHYETFHLEKCVLMLWYAPRKGNQTKLTSGDNIKAIKNK